MLAQDPLSISLWVHHILLWLFLQTTIHTREFRMSWMLFCLIFTINSYPSMSRAVQEPFPPTKVVHVIHHSKHHSSSKNKHKHSGHGHSHSHSHSHPRRMPSPSPMTSFPISPSTSFPVQSPQFSFPAVPHHPQIRSSSSHGILKVPSASPHVHFSAPHRPPVRSSSSNGLHKAASPSHHHSKPAPKQSSKHNVLTKRNPLPVKPLHPDFQYSKCTGRRRALCVCLLKI